MKKIHFFQIIILVVIVIVSANCTKEAPATGYNTGTTNLPQPNQPPEANAGVDFSIVLLSNEMTLRGLAFDPDMGNTLSITWTKIAGPPCTIVSPQSLVTNVSNLIEGVYQFELLAIDNYGLTDRDTITFRAISFGSLTNFVNFFNLRWTCPMGCTISVPDIYSHIPSNTPIRVFIKFVNQAGWHEVAPISQYSLSNSTYFYQFHGSEMIIYTETDMSINADIRISF